MQLSLHHKCQISRIARFSLLESLRMRIEVNSLHAFISIFSPFLHSSDKGHRFQRMKREMMLHVFAHCTMRQLTKKSTQTATPVVVLSSSRIICKICNLFSKLFTYVEEDEVCPKLVPCRR